MRRIRVGSLVAIPPDSEWNIVTDKGAYVADMTACECAYLENGEIRYSTLVVIKFDIGPHEFKWVQTIFEGRCEAVEVVLRMFENGTVYADLIVEHEKKCFEAGMSSGTLRALRERLEPGLPVEKSYLFRMAEAIGGTNADVARGLCHTGD